MSFDHQKILKAVRDARGGVASSKDVLTRLGAHPRELKALEHALRDLAQSGKLRRLGKRYLVPAEAPPQVTFDAPGRERGDRGREKPEGGSERRRPEGLLGTLKKHPDGFGFVRRLDGEGSDLYVSGRELEAALDGDLVRVLEVRGSKGRTAGQLLEIVERRRTRFIGVYQQRGRGAVVMPVDRALPPAMQVPLHPKARDGQLVKGQLVGDPRTGLPPEAEITELLADAGAPEVEVLSALYAQGFSDEFPSAVLAESERVPDHVTPAEREGRRDLTSTPLVTIDGEDARDFDDAVFVERKGGGWRLVVAIADVSHYVRPGQPLDAEALHRGTSVYFPDRAVPMLPERLSNGICSLKPHVPRLCLVADMTLAADGSPQSAETYPAVMQSQARCTYTQVAAVLAGEVVPELAHVRAHLTLAGELAKQMTQRRIGRGALDFDLPEAKILLDKDGVVTDVARRERNDAHRLVEEFMLAANEAVARWFGEREHPTVYRVHGSPDPEKLASFASLAGAHGHVLAIDPAKGVAPRALNAFLKELKGRPEERALNQLLLRSMMQAEYSAENVGHYGLAAEHYLHFTSPIRRYPDLAVHRLLREHWGRGRGLRAPEKDALLASLESVASQSSERERASMSAEREVAAFYAATLMAGHLGERFAGTIAGVTENGFFVELMSPFVEGFVRADDIGDSYELEPETGRLVFGRSGRAFTVGDAVEIVVRSSDPQRRRIDFAVADLAASAGAKTPRTDARAEVQSSPRTRQKPRAGAKPSSSGGRGPRGRR